MSINDEFLLAGTTKDQAMQSQTSLVDAAEQRRDHLPSHESGPTWCWYCGTFDIYFDTTQCYEMNDTNAWWRGDEEQARRAAMPYIYRDLDGPLSETKRGMLRIGESVEHIR